jgi:hypothetical protein
MSGTTPRRRHSPAVYRRRRIVLLVGIIVIGVGIWLAIAQPWRGMASEGQERTDPAHTQDAATSLPIPSSAETPAADDAATDADAADAAGEDTAATPSPSATPTAEPCLPRDIKVEAVTDQPTYASGQNPQLSIQLTNSGSTDCTLNVGTSAQVFTITSGSDVWWKSTDCQSEPSDMVVLLAAGQTVASAAPLTWDRTRSSVGTCADADRPRAPGGGSSYHLDVEIGGIASTDSAQLLLY